MPELPDVETYLHGLRTHVAGDALEGVRIISPSLVRTVDPPLRSLVGRCVQDVRRIGKRIVLGFDDDLFVVIHPMIAGRLEWRARGTAVPRKRCHGALDFPRGALLLTEASTRKRASLHVVRGEAALAAHDPGGVEVLDLPVDRFTERLRARSHTLKRALTDPRIFSGIGNAYSDEILHRARLSPVRLTGSLSDEEAAALHAATVSTLEEWRDRLLAEVGDGFPEKVTAFRPGMAVHGRYREPCPDCASPVQRIVYARREVNYCARCQNQGRLLADRALSRLLKADWPRTLEELETLRAE
jgi:formamidopyrimidine-DNA glycosylase